MTPPSQFPPVLPLSQEMPVVAANTGDFELEVATDSYVDASSTTPMPLPATVPAAIAETPSRPIEYPRIKKSRSSLVIAAVALVGIGGAATYLALAGNNNTTAIRASEPIVTPIAAPPPAAPRPTAPPPVVKAEPAPVVEVVPEPITVHAEEPATPKPADDRPVPKKPVIAPKRPIPRHAVAPKPADEPAKDTKEPPKPPSKDKDPAWNIDSPFLPSQH